MMTPMQNQKTKKKKKKIQQQNTHKTAGAFPDCGKVSSASYRFVYAKILRDNLNDI